MVANRSITVLEDFRFIAKYSFLCNDDEIWIGRVRIPNVTIFGLMTVVTVSTAALSFALCFEGDFNLNDVALPLICGLTYLQLSLIHIALAFNRNAVVDVIDYYLQDAISSSEQILSLLFQPKC